MLDNLSAMAIVPKAKAIGARRLSREEYGELMRRRSVVEVVSALQSHPYFQKSLAGLSTTGIHRAQLEEALQKDVFFKYETMMRYSFRAGHFGAFFLVRCEIDELLAKLKLVALGIPQNYIVHMPGFLASHARFSLLKLAKAQTAQDCMKVLAGTRYAKVLEDCLPTHGKPLDFLVCEHAFETFYYNDVLQKIRRDLHGHAAKETWELFLIEAEVYNLDLLFRCKAFYAEQFTPAQLQALLLPFYYHMSERDLRPLVQARDLDGFLRLYNASRAARYYGGRTANMGDASDTAEYRTLYRSAEHLLHFTSTPQAALAAVLCLATLERSNIINVIEGVRYGLSPEQIDAFLKY